MRRIFPRFMVISALALPWSSLRAQESGVGQELRELRATVQQQSKQIELLAEQVGRLTRALDGQKSAESAAPGPAAEPAKTVAEPSPLVPADDSIPKAEAVPAGPKHVVAKGETLTSIAKHYNIPIAELKNANKIENERKLQIGQVLTVPSTKAPEPTDKKENP